MEYFLSIVTKGDNIPIAGLIPIMIFFTWLSMKQAFHHDKLIKEGKEKDILEDMYK